MFNNVELTLCVMTSKTSYAALLVPPAVNEVDGLPPAKVTLKDSVTKNAYRQKQKIARGNLILGDHALTFESVLTLLNLSI